MDNSLNSLYVKTNPNYRPPTLLWPPINNRFYIEPSVVILLRHLQASMLNVLFFENGCHGIIYREVTLIYPGV